MLTAIFYCEWESFRDICMAASFKDMITCYFFSFRTPQELDQPISLLDMQLHFMGLGGVHVRSSTLSTLLRVGL